MRIEPLSEVANSIRYKFFLFTLAATDSSGGKTTQTKNWDMWRCRVNAATDWHVPALFMEGRAPFRAQRRFPPKGTYCWLRGKLSVLRSCRRCFSLKIEWTVFRKSFLLSGELMGKRRGIFLVWRSVDNGRQDRVRASFHLSSGDFN